MICIWHPIISCFIKIQLGLSFLVLAYPGCPGKETIKRVSSCHQTSVLPTEALMFVRSCGMVYYHPCYRTSAAKVVSNNWKHFCSGASWPQHIVTAFCIIEIFLLTNWPAEWRSFWTEISCKCGSNLLSCDTHYHFYRVVVGLVPHSIRFSCMSVVYIK